MKGGYYVDEGEADDRVYYGPYASEPEAFAAAYFIRSVSERDRHACYGHGPRMLRNYGQYEAEEIQGLRDNPALCGYRSVVIRSPEEATEHASWAEFDAGLKAKLLADDMRQAIGSYCEIPEEYA